MSQAQEPIKAAGTGSKKSNGARARAGAKAEPNASKPSVKQGDLGSPAAPARRSPRPKQAAPPPPAVPPVIEEEKSDLFTELWLRFGRYGWDALGVSLIAFALTTLIGFLSRGQSWGQGFVISLWVAVVAKWLGWGWPLVVVVIALLGLICLRRRFAYWPKFHLGRVLALELLAFSALAMLSIWNGWSLDRAEAGLDGGVIGWGLANLLGRALPDPWGIISLTGLMMFLAVYGSGLMSLFIRRLEGWLDAVNPVGAGAAAMAGSIEMAGFREAGASAKADAARTDAEEDEAAAAPLPTDPAVRNPDLPPLTLLLDEQSIRPEESAIQETALKIKNTLAEYGVPVNVIGYRIGPTVTQYAVEPDYIEKAGPEGETIRQKVRVSQISALSRDLALALSAERLRIEAPVPGRSYVGIEVPNQTNAVVRMRPLLESEQFRKLSSPLAVALGRDVSGQPLVADLSRMPHLLIAGTTGSGKSVCIEAITTCLVMNNTPADLRLALLDPKMVELVRFNGLPHLLGNVETELDRMLGVLHWAINEMDHRYRLLEDARARDIFVYNRKMEKRGQPGLPRIVVIIDELADLMMTAPDQTEHSLIRLAQLARATGIHLVVATQRPSTDVVTGLIKANFPARMAFTVASSIDSRVILDGSGAETLLGKGDMLFLNPEAGTPLRAQGILVSDGEIEAVISYWKEKLANDPTAGKEPPPWEELIQAGKEDEDSDGLVEQAVKIVRTTQRASTSLLQRRLRVGYPRAARLMDQLEELGVVGPSQGGGREREVLVSPEDSDSDSDIGGLGGGESPTSYGRGSAFDQETAARHEEIREDDDNQEDEDDGDRAG